MYSKFYTRVMRLGFNFFPVYRRMGGRVTRISQDLREIDVKVPLNLFTRNYVKTIYGGCMFGAADGIYMFMLMNLLGRDYIVWDKSSVIKFRKPGIGTLYANFRVNDNDLAEIISGLNSKDSVLRDFMVEFRDKEGIVCAEITKTLYFRRKRKA